MNRPATAVHSATLLDVLERVLDKGVVVTGDIRVSLVDVELLTIRIRLIVCSVERAEALGLDWWRHDALALTRRVSELEGENRRLREAAARSPAGGLP